MISYGDFALRLGCRPEQLDYNINQRPGVVPIRQSKRSTWSNRNRRSVVPASSDCIGQLQRDAILRRRFGHGWAIPTPHFLHNREPTRASFYFRVPSVALCSGVIASGNVPDVRGSAVGGSVFRVTRRFQGSCPVLSVFGFCARSHSNKRVGRTKVLIIAHTGRAPSLHELYSVHCVALVIE